MGRSTAGWFFSSVLEYLERSKTQYKVADQPAQRPSLSPLSLGGGHWLAAAGVFGEPGLANEWAFLLYSGGIIEPQQHRKTCQRRAGCGRALCSLMGWLE